MSDKGALPSDILKKPYARLVLPDEDGTYSAEIVEFPGCFAVGGTPAEALSNLDEVAVDWVSAALEQGQDIPEPTECPTRAAANSRFAELRGMYSLLVLAEKELLAFEMEAYDWRSCALDNAYRWNKTALDQCRKKYIGSMERKEREAVTKP